VKSAATAPTGSAREGSNVYLGTIPDMAQSETPGLRLTGVRTGSPAGQAGLMAGDIIVELGGKPVKDLYEYSDALYSHQPGEQVKIVVLRKNERVTLTVTLGKRGG
jgi:S1-C subfamily serine protease